MCKDGEINMSQFIKRFKKKNFDIKILISFDVDGFVITMESSFLSKEGVSVLDSIFNLKNKKEFFSLFVFNNYSEYNRYIFKMGKEIKNVRLEIMKRYLYEYGL